MRVLVAGGAGFIGTHLVRRLKNEGHWVRRADIRPRGSNAKKVDEEMVADLRHVQSCLEATENIDCVYALAADMGGMGYIATHDAQILSSNALIDVNLMKASRDNAVTMFFYASSACVYPESRQQEPSGPPLREEDAYPACPPDGYGWEKLFGERLCTYCEVDFGLSVRIARLHNVYGPGGVFRGGREKAPAALCRKVAEAPIGGEIEVWGDGKQTRSFCYIEDCLDGMERLTQSAYSAPLNIGSAADVTIDELASLIVNVAGRRDLRISHVSGPQGVRGRASDNRRAQEILEWEPSVPLVVGIEQTYQWVHDAVRMGL